MAGMGLRLGLHLGGNTGGGTPTPTPAPLTMATLLSLVPAGSYIDHNPESLALGAVSTWAASTGSSNGAQATTVRQPAVTASWGSRKTVDFSGVSTTDPDFLVFDETHIATPMNLLVLIRGANQNTVNNDKWILGQPRAGDNYLSVTAMGSTTSDAAQTGIRYLGLGGSSNAQRTGFGAGKGGVSLSITGIASHGGVFNGADIVKGATQNGTGNTASTIMGCHPSTLSQGGTFKVARRVRFDLAQLPGGEFQLYTQKLFAAVAAWDYGIPGDTNLDLVANLPAGNPWKSAQPTTAAYFPFPITPQKWGNSLGNYVFAQSFTAWDATNKGLNIQNGCVGGTDSGQILVRIQTNLDANGGTNSGLSQARIREKVHFVSDLRENDSGNGLSQATGRQNIADIMALLEAGQGKATGQGRIVYWGRWRGNGEPGTDGRLANSDAEMATDIAEYPNYVVYDPISGRTGMGQILAYDARPGGPAEDADAWARGVMPTAYRLGGGDQLHPSPAGSLRAAEIERAFALLKGWTV